MTAIFDGVHGMLLDDLQSGIGHMEAWIKENFGLCELDYEQEVWEFCEPCVPDYTNDLLEAANESSAALEINADTDVDDERGKSIPNIIRIRYVRVMAERLGLWCRRYIDTLEECLYCGKGFEEDDLYYTKADDDGPFCKTCLDLLEEED